MYACVIINRDSDFCSGMSVKVSCMLESLSKYIKDSYNTALKIILNEGLTVCKESKPGDREDGEAYLEWTDSDTKIVFSTEWIVIDDADFIRSEE